MKQFRLWAAPALLLIAGCTTNNNSLPSISNDRTSEFLNKFEMISESDSRNWKNFQSRVTQSGENLLTTWLQPMNKGIPCKIYSSSSSEQGSSPWWRDTSAKYYWDGECKNGYAYGLGREFLYTKGKIYAWLADYSGGENMPSYYLQVDYDSNYIAFMAKDPQHVVFLEYQVEQNPSKKGIAIKESYFNFSSARAYIKEMAIGNDAYVMSMGMPSKKRYAIHRIKNSNKDIRVFSTFDENNQNVGYSTEIVANPLVNNQIRHVEYIGQSQTRPVELPRGYLSYIINIGNKISSELDAGDNLLKESFVAVNKYRRMICNGKVSVNYVVDDIYGRICLKNGELSPYEDLITQLETQQKEKQSIEREQFAQAKDARLQQQRINAQQSQQNANSLANSVNQFSRDMAELNYNATQTAQSYIGSMPSPTFGSWGNQGNNQINCVKISNIVNCRGQ